METCCFRRLADSSIWIAFYRIGRLGTLLSVPGLAIARPVVRELRAGTDDLARRVEGTLGADCFDVEIVADGLTATLTDILQVNDKRLSDADASQVAYAQTHADATRLYMRDGPAQRQARRIGAPVSSHEDLVDDMVRLSVLAPEQGAELRRQLTEYFQRRGRRRAIP